MNNFAWHDRTGLKFKEHGLIVEVDEKGNTDRDPDYQRKRQKELEKLG